jgi:hypothetical protein
VPDTALLYRFFEPTPLVPTSNQYPLTPVPLVHWNVTVPPIVDPGIGLLRVALPEVVVLPASDTVVGLPFALCTIEIDALLLPVLVGVNVTLIVQLLPATTLEQVFVWENRAESNPERLTLLTASVAVPVLVTVIDWAALVAFTVV